MNEPNEQAQSRYDELAEIQQKYDRIHQCYLEALEQLNEYNRAVGEYQWVLKPDSCPTCETIITDWKSGRTDRN